jgi:SAM-dependent methyltransferase
MYRSSGSRPDTKPGRPDGCPEWKRAGEPWPRTCRLTRTRQFREGLAEALPVEDAWADVVISNGVINLCVDKQAVLAEMFRVLRPGGRLQFADIANGRPVPAEALRDIDLWTG